jgi:hypothetical protein
VNAGGKRRRSAMRSSHRCAADPGLARGVAPARVALALSVAVAILLPVAAAAQDLEPRSYANTPVGINFLVAAYAYSMGGLSTDPSLPLENAELDVHSEVFAYARSFGLLGRSAKFDAILPVAELSGSAELAGVHYERNVSGLLDPRLRVSWNFFGAPAHELADHASHPQDVIAGVSLQVAVPLGQYDSTRAVNLGTNRWAIKPEVGISKAVGKFILELQTGLAIYTDNGDFFGGSTREQEPIYSIQGHAIYNITRGMWAAFDVIWYGGGRTTIDGVKKDDEQGNLRLGGTLAIPVTAHQSVKLHASGAAVTSVGTDFTSVGIAWQYRWGGGL